MSQRRCPECGRRPNGPFWEVTYVETMVREEPAPPLTPAPLTMKVTSTRRVCSGCAHKYEQKRQLPRESP